MTFHRFVLKIALGSLKQFRFTAVLASIVLAANVQRAQAQPVDGRLDVVEDCDNFVLGFPLPFVGFIGTAGFPDASWVRVARRGSFAPPPFVEDRRFVSITGVVAESPNIGDYPGAPLGDEAVVNFKDFPDSHDSHDMNFYVRLDSTAANNGAVSTFGLDHFGRDPGDEGYTPDTIEVEWETGILTSQLLGDGVFFPKSMWPVAGDRVWVNGYWVFDCQHEQENESTGEKGLRTEIHPPRALAVMRNQVATPPAGGPPIPVTAVDLYIHGRAGVVVDLLECGGDVLFTSIQFPPPFRAPCPTRLGYTPPGSDSDDGDPGHDIALDHLGILIVSDFDFTVCTPKQPPGMSPDAEPIRWATEGAGPEPDLETVEPASDGCADPNLYGPKQIHVTVRLAGSGLTPDAAYTRQIFVGWAATPQPMRRVKLTLNSMRLGFDHDTGILGSDDDCECSWFWMSVDRAPGEWRRLSDHADDDDPDEVDGNEHLNNFSDGTTRTFTGATWEFTMPAEPNLQSFVIRAFGFDGGVGEDVTPVAFDQDCLDDHFAHHEIEEHVNLVPPFELPDACYLGVVLNGNDSSHGDDDPFDIVRREITAADIAGFFGPWPGVGSASMSARSSPLRCLVTYLLPVGGATSDRVACASAEQARERYENDGFVVIDVNEYHEVNLDLTIESLPADSDGDGISDPDEISDGTNPLDADSDDDGLTDGEEETLGTDPNDSDSDDDGLFDGDEVHVHHTDPLDADTDDDELPDGIEVGNGSDPLDSDSDNDGIIDGEDVEWLQNAIRAVGAAAFRDSGVGLREAMLAQLDAIEIDIANLRRQAAIQKLGRLRTNVDGCGAAADNNDWIIDCLAQQEIRALIDLLVSNLG
jgi:hypothetical protein